MKDKIIAIVFSILLFTLGILIGHYKIPDHRNAARTVNFDLRPVENKRLVTFSASNNSCELSYWSQAGSFEIRNLDTNLCDLVDTKDNRSETDIAEEKKQLEEYTNHIGVDHAVPLHMNSSSKQRQTDWYYYESPQIKKP